MPGQVRVNKNHRRPTRDLIGSGGSSAAGSALELSLWVEMICGVNYFKSLLMLMSASVTALGVHAVLRQFADCP